MEWGRGNNPTPGDLDIGLGVHRSLRGPSEPPGHGAEPREWHQESKLEELAVVWGHKESPVWAQMWKLAFPSLVEVSAAAARCTIDFPWMVTRWPSASPRDLCSGCSGAVCCSGALRAAAASAISQFVFCFVFFFSARQSECLFAL